MAEKNIYKNNKKSINKAVGKLNKILNRFLITRNHLQKNKNKSLKHICLYDKMNIYFGAIT